jgi:hypothetical protein
MLMISNFSSWPMLFCCGYVLACIAEWVRLLMNKLSSDGLSMLLARPRRSSKFVSHIHLPFQAKLTSFEGGLGGGLPSTACAM